MTHPETSSNRRTPGGPHLGVVALVSLALTVAGVLRARGLSGGAVGASPFGDPGDYAAGIAHHHDAVRVLALFQLGAAVPLLVVAATVRVQLQRMGARVPGPVIALAGGVTAAALLMVAGCATFAQASPAVAGDTAVVSVLGWLAFAAGGTGYAMGTGLLVAGIAVPALILGLLPRPLAWAGLLLAVLSELAWFSLVADPAQYLIPVARFLGGLWLVVAGFLLTRPGTSRGAVPS